MIFSSEYLHWSVLAVFALFRRVQTAQRVLLKIATAQLLRITRKYRIYSIGSRP